MRTVFCSTIRQKAYLRLVAAAALHNLFRSYMPPFSEGTAVRVEVALKPMEMSANS